MPLIYIPTRGRVARQDTWDSLTPELRRVAVLVCGEDEADAHRTVGRNVLVYPGPPGVAPKRQWILEQHEGRSLIMCDDDLNFLIRKAPGHWQLRSCEPHEVNRIFDLIDGGLDTYAAVGISVRQGNNRYTTDTVENTRLVHVHGWRADILKKHGIRFDAVPLMEDFHATLSLLQLGYKNVMLCDRAVGQGSSNQPGGCSLYRTNELQTQAATSLAALHHPFVRLKQKESKSGWEGMQTRTDVVISWKKAFDSAGQTREVPR